uniref:Uncharacterized protein n=1 Tax=Acrobeloides nanus TaxID=290746 RepID=A0A914CH51_9BILA
MKLIYRPERIRKVEIHYKNQYEINPRTNRQYEHIVIEPNVAVKLHMRQNFETNFTPEIATSSEIIQNFALKANETFFQRLHKDSQIFKFVALPMSEITRIIKEIDDCWRKELYIKCLSVYRCENEEKINMKNLSLIRVKNSWVYI